MATDASRPIAFTVGGGDLGKHIFFQSGLQRRLRADDFDTKGTAGHALLVPTVPCGWKN